MLKINNKSISSVYDETTSIEKIMKGTLLVYEYWRKLIASGVPPITLQKCKGANLVDYKIYGNSIQEEKFYPKLETLGFLPASGTYPTTNTTYPNATYEIIPIKAGQRYDFNYYGEDITNLRLRCIYNGNIIGDVGYGNLGTDNIYFTTTIYYGATRPQNGYIIAKQDLELGLMYLIEKSSNFKLEITSTIPTPDAPIEIESVGDKTKNLWHTENVAFPITVMGVTIDYDENEQVYTFNGTSTGAGDVYICPNGKEIMNIKAGETYTMTSYQLGGNISGTYASIGVGAFINNDSWSGGMRVNPNKTVSKTWDVDYRVTKMYFYIHYKDITFDNVKIKVQLEKGNVATKFEHYGYRIPVKVSGVNLHNHKIFNYTEQTINGITFTPLKDGSFYVKGKLEDINKTSAYRVIKDNAIPISAGTYRSKKHDDDLSILFGVQMSGGSSVNVNSNGANGIEIVKTNGYVRSCMLYISAGVTREFDEIVYPQLVKGTANYPYQPYVEPVTTNIYLNEPLRKIGDYADYIDFENQKVVRQIYKYIFTGGENWIEYSNGTTAMTNLTHVGLRTSYKELSNRFKDYSTTSALSMSLTNKETNRIGIDQYKTIPGVTDINTLKTWLANNKTYFIYHLKTPKEETIELPNILLNKGTNIIEIDTNILPSNMEVVYYGKGKLEKLEETDNIVLNDILNDNTETEIDITDTEINQILDEIIGG